MEDRRLWKTQWCIRQIVFLDPRISCAQVLSVRNMNNWNSHSYKSGLIQKTADVAYTEQENWNPFQKVRIWCSKETNNFHFELILLLREDLE